VPAPAAPHEAEPDSTPTAPTVSNAPEPPRLSIRLPPALLALPFAALATYLLLANRPTLRDGALDANAAPAEAVASSVAPTPLSDDSAVERPALDPAQSLLHAAKLVELEEARERALRAAEQLDAARHQLKVVLYTSERCTRCAEARTHLVAQGIRPIERDIDKDPRARARHRAISRKGGLPTIEVDGKVLVGFQEERLQKAIDRAAALRVQRKR
jgi:glutaredoxin 3